MAHPAVRLPRHRLRPPQMPIDTPRALDVLRDGEIEIVGRLLGSSNHAMLCRVRLACPEPGETIVLEAVYKPTAGERPLDDFPDGTLSHREVAAFLVSEAIGWSVVPPTIRRDGPFGDGSLQLWIDIDPAVDVVGMVVEDDRRLRRIAVFDAAVNNTDRNFTLPGRCGSERLFRRGQGLASQSGNRVTAFHDD